MVIPLRLIYNGSSIENDIIVALEPILAVHVKLTTLANDNRTARRPQRFEVFKGILRRSDFKRTIADDGAARI